MASTISIMIVILVLGIVVDLIFTRIDAIRRSRRRAGGMLDPAVFVDGGHGCARLPGRAWEGGGHGVPVDIRSKYVGLRRDRAGWRAVVADGDAQGGAGVARVDAAAPDGRHSRAGDGRAGRGGAGARPGSAGAAARGTPRSWRTRGRAGAGAGAGRGAGRAGRAGRGRVCQLDRHAVPASGVSSGGCCGRRSRTVRMSGCRWRGGIRSRWPPPTGSALAPVAAKLVGGGTAAVRVPVRGVRGRAAGRGRCGTTRYWRRSIPDLDSVVNVNEPADYQAARAPASAGGDDPAVRAAGRAVTAARSRCWPPPWPRRRPRAGLALDGHVVAALNGDQITRDGETPAGGR